MYYTVNVLRKLISTEIEKQKGSFNLTEFLSYYAKRYDPSIKEVNKSFLCSKDNVIVLNAFEENESPRHFDEITQERISFSLAILVGQQIHCFDIDLNGSITLEAIACVEGYNIESTIPHSFYISLDDEEKGIVLEIPKKSLTEKTNNEYTYIEFGRAA